jgi:outer membrane receptor protein involved in Fe transport
VGLSYHIETKRKADDISYLTQSSFIGADLSVFEPATSPSLPITRQPVNLKDIHQVNVSGTYEINDAVSVFAQVNNLLFQRYDLWYGYPAQNFNVMAGINWKF